MNIGLSPAHPPHCHQGYWTEASGERPELESPLGVGGPVSDMKSVETEKKKVMKVSLESQQWKKDVKDVKKKPQGFVFELWSRGHVAAFRTQDQREIQRRLA